MKDFFEYLEKEIPFELQMYISIGLLLFLVLLCFIMLLVVGLKCKKLAKKVDELENSGKQDEPEENPDAEDADGAENGTRKAIDPETIDYGDSEGSEDKEAETNEETEALFPEDIESPVAPEPEKGDTVPDETGSKDFDGEAVIVGDQKGFNETIENEINALKEKTDLIAKNQRKSFDKIKVVRYSSNLPDGTEAKLYSIGITNQDNDGIVLTGTEQPDGGTSLVVKSVKGGVSKVPLTPAEDCAVKRTAK